MPDEDILREGSQREFEAMDIVLATAAMRAPLTLDEYIRLRLLEGADPRVLLDELVEDLNTGGRIFGEFRNTIRASYNGVINRFRDVGQFSEVGVNERYRWAAVLVNTCSRPDGFVASVGSQYCLERHGLSQLYEQWERVGLPRTNRTVCKQNCRCMLVPEKTTEIEPVKMARGKKK